MTICHWSRRKKAQRHRKLPTLKITCVKSSKSLAVKVEFSCNDFLSNKQMTRVPCCSYSTNGIHNAEQRDLPPRESRPVAVAAGQRLVTNALQIYFWTKLELGEKCSKQVVDWASRATGSNMVKSWNEVNNFNPFPVTWLPSVNLHFPAQESLRSIWIL